MYSILFISSHSSETQLLREALQVAGVDTDIKVIADEHEALDYARIKDTQKDLPPPDLVLIDFRRPDIEGDGYAELVEFLDHSETFNVPLLVMSLYIKLFEHAKHPETLTRLFVQKPRSWAEYVGLGHRIGALLPIPPGEPPAPEVSNAL